MAMGDKPWMDPTTLRLVADMLDRRTKEIGTRHLPSTAYDLGAYDEAARWRRKLRQAAARFEREEKSHG